MDDYEFEDIVDLLDQHHQRATYGAVGDLVGKHATFLMNGIERSPRYSWIVNQKTLLPTGYSADEMHPALEEKKRFVLMNDGSSESG